MFGSIASWLPAAIVRAELEKLVKRVAIFTLTAMRDGELPKALKPYEPEIDAVCSLLLDVLNTENAKAKAALMASEGPENPK